MKVELFIWYTLLYFQLCLCERAPTWGSCRCSWNQWESWSSCTALCGGGYQQRSRSVQTICNEFTDCATAGSGWQTRSCGTECFHGEFNLYSYSEIFGYCTCVKGWTGKCCDQGNGIALHYHTRHKRGILDVVFCIITFFSCLWGGRAKPDPDPPHIPCIQNIYATAIPIQTYAVVHWEEPIATDSRHKKYVPKRYGKGPGMSFGEGTTKVVYVAKNRRGEEGRCVMSIHVEVKRCKPVPSPIKHGYLLCHPSTDFVYGSVCKFGCYRGFELSPLDVTSMTCENSTRWSKKQPICKAFQCPQLEEIKGAQLSCSNGRFYQSICTYNCKSGFDMPPRVSKTLVCTRYKTWRSHGNPKCIDVEPPKFDFCPDTVVHGTGTGVNTSLVSWKAPSVVDNSNLTITAKQVKGPPFESKVTAGIYQIIYGAHDAEGNKAKNCEFKVIVKDVMCHRLYRTPNLRFSCQNGYRTGSGCNISCDPGTVLDGLQYVQCDKSNEGLFGEWNWRDGIQSTCERTNKCVPLSPPKNGAVVCDNWTGGLFCQFQCKQGTDMANVDWRRLHTCSKDGKWIPDPIIKACNKLRSSQQSLEVEASFYFDGECTDMETKEEIANNFITSIKNSFFNEAWNSPQCTPVNVQITCGESERKRRAIENENHKMLTISAKLALVNTVENQTFYELHQTYVLLYHNFKSHILSEVSSILKRNVTVLSIKNHGIKVICPAGAVKTGQNLNCVECPEGTYYRTGTGTCEFCDKGTYQNETGQLYCHRCPLDTTTRSDGASSADDCELACLPGTFSLNGLHPCSPCENGFYQISSGQSSCRGCSGGMTTLNVGAKSISECQEFDIGLPLGMKKNIKSVLDETVHVENFSISFWIRKLYQNEESNLSISLVDDKNKEVWSYTKFEKLYAFNQSYENMTLDILDTKWHHVMVISKRCTVQIYFDKIPVTHMQDLYPCHNFSLEGIKIGADKNFAGHISQLNIWSNLETSRISSKCFSPSGGDVFAWKRFGQSVLDGSFIQIPSTCDDFNNCVSSPCLHGTCFDELGTFSCICEAGYSGKQCDVNKDDCEENICMDGATCVDGIDTYSCQCPENHTGLYCEIQMVNGGWSEWGPWSECSASCGRGQKSRKRLCNNPYPDSGGDECVGNNIEHGICNETVCRSCASLQAPSNGTIDCSKENGTIACNITCNEGYEFDIAPLDNYVCGPETFHEWNFETADNPSRKLPSCLEVEMPESIEVQYSARYRDLYCFNDNFTKETNDKIESIVKHVIASSIYCIVARTCELIHLDVVGCSGQERERRSTDTAGFTFTLFTSPNRGHGEEKLSDLQEAFRKIQDAAENGEFTIEISNDKFILDNDLTSLNGNLHCGRGMTRVNHYCVPCGKGSYLYKDLCHFCDQGKYQDEIGQISCRNCPKGLTTLGIGSVSAEECFVESVLDNEKGIRGLTVALATSIPVGVVVLLICIYLTLKFKLRKPVDPAKMSEFPMQHTTSDPLGKPNRRFNTELL